MQDDDDDDDGGGHEVGAMQGATSATAVSPSWTWGSTTTVTLASPTPALFFFGQSQQLAQVSLPEPAVCSIYFQADVTADKPTNVLRVFNIRFSQGVGRTTVIREISYLNQPAPLAPLEVTLPFMPLHALQVDVVAGADFGPGGGQIDVNVSLILTPLTRIPQKAQKLAFGMAMPGEADDLDDELSGEFEAEGPSVIEAMREGRGPDDGSSPQERDHRPEPQVERSPAWLLTLVDQMTRKLGRQPTRPELARAVRRLRQRVARRAGR